MYTYILYIIDSIILKLVLILVIIKIVSYTINIALLSCI